jgi:hypothetical protein
MAQSHDLTSAFDYLVWDPLYQREKPFQVLTDIPKESADQRKDNLSFKTGPPETIHDVRGHEQSYSLDRHGFAYIKHRTKFSIAELHNGGIVQQQYFAECEEILRGHLNGVDKIRIFDWRVSKNHSR